MNPKPWILLCLLFLPGLRADQRYYVWTYQYSGLSRGEAEIETYTTYLYPNKGDFGNQAFTRHQVEVEVGMSNRLDVGVYQTFYQNPDEGLTYSGFKLRFRYRMGSPGESFLDRQLYLEYKSNPPFSEQAVESKFILAHDWGKINLSLNPAIELEWENRNRSIRFEWTSGLSFKLHSLVRIGLDLKTSGNNWFAGPVISHGNGRFWVAAGSLSALDPATAPRTQLRLILGLEL
ncbi:MAG: hypothetical protein ACE5D1_00070 [Fidelibacterota bacterium]